MFNFIVNNLVFALFKEAFLPQAGKSNQQIDKLGQEGVMRAKEMGSENYGNDTGIPEMPLTPQDLTQVAPERIIVDEIPEPSAFWFVKDNSLAKKLGSPMPIQSTAPVADADSVVDMSESLISGARTGERRNGGRE